MKRKILFLLLLLLFNPSICLASEPNEPNQYEVLEGWASQYGKGVMQRVIKTRQAGRTSHPLPVNLPDVDGYAAALSPDAIGQIWFIQHEGSSDFERILIVDCGGTGDGGAAWMARNNILVEVDYETASRWNTIGRGIRVTAFMPTRNN